MSADSILAQWSAAQTQLVENAGSRVFGVRAGRCRAGTAFAWRDDWLTASAEVVSGNQEVILTGREGERAARVVALDAATDVAVLRADGLPGTAATPESAGAAVGAPALIVGRTGSDLVARWSTTESIGPGWISRRGGEISQHLQFAGCLDRMLEGAPIVNVGGELLAMAVSSPRARVLGIPFATLARVVERVIQHGRLPQPFLGVRLQSLPLDETARRQLQRHRVGLVAGVVSGSPAERAGLHIGDLLIGVGGTAIRDSRDLLRRLGRTDPGVELTLEIHRGGQLMSLTAVPADAGAH